MGVDNFLNPYDGIKFSEKNLKYYLVNGKDVITLNTKLNKYERSIDRDNYSGAMLNVNGNYFKSLVTVSYIDAAHPESSILNPPEPYTPYSYKGQLNYLLDKDVEFKTAEDIQEVVIKLNKEFWFPTIGEVDRFEIIKANDRAISLMHEYSKNPVNRLMGGAYLNGEYRFVEGVNKNNNRYNSDVVTYAGSYHIHQTESEKNKIIECEKVFVPGIYGRTKERLKLCYLEITIPSHRYVNEVYNPSEYLVDYTKLEILNTRIHLTNFTIDYGIEYYRSYYGDIDLGGYHYIGVKYEFLGWRCAPIYVNESPNAKGGDKMAYSPRLRPTNLKAHVMGRNALNDLNRRMWDTSILKRITGYYSGGDLGTYFNNLVISPKEAGKNVVSCKWFFGLNRESFLVTDMVKENLNHTLRVGNLDVTLDHNFLDVDDETAFLMETQHFLTNTIDRESLECPATSYDLYLPYYGYLSLDDIHENDVININLRANIVTGVGCWVITTKDRFVACVECRVGLDVPLNANKNESLVDNTLNTFVPTATRVIGAVTGGLAGAVVGDAIGNLAGFGQSNGYGNAVTSSVGPDGILNGMHSIFLTVKRPVLYDGSGFSGYDVLEKATVKTFNRYVKAQDINKESFGGIPAWAIEEIEAKLKEGVYINP